MDLDVILATRRLSIVCVGNELNGDDGAGPILYEKIRDLQNERLQLIDAKTVPENFLGPIVEFRPDVVLVVDAADFGGAPGEWRFIKEEEIGNFSVSSHGGNLGLIERFLKGKGIQTRFLGIQPRQTAIGTSVSPDVAQSVDALSKKIAASSRGHLK